MQRNLAFVLATVTVLAVAHTAHADPGDKSPAVATGLSIGGSLVGPLLLLGASQANSQGLGYAGAAAVLVGPSVGEWYSGKPLTWGMGLRAAGAVALVAGAVDAQCFDGAPCGGEKTGPALMIAGGAALVGGTLYDIFDAAPSARSWNAEHHVEIAPTVVKGQPGVAIAGTF